MSDLTAANCGCNQTSTANSCGGNSFLWIIILLFLCGGCGNSSTFGNNGCGCGDNNGSSCEWIIILLILFSCCGNGNGFSFCG